MNRNVLLIGIVAAAASTSAATAQQPVRRLTLDQAMQLFGTHSLNLRVSRANASEIVGLAHQSTTFPNPTLTGTHELLSGGGTDYTESYLNLSQRFEWPGVRSARGSAAESRIRAATAQLAADSAHLAFELKRAYVDALRAELELEVIIRVTEVFRTAEGSAVRRLEEQDISRYAFRRIQVERARYEADLAEATIEVAAARRALALLALPQEPAVSVAPADWPATERPSIDFEQMIEQVMDKRSELVAANAELGAARSFATTARRERIPDVTATGGYKRQTGALRGAFLGLSLPLPLWDRRSGAIDAATARVEAAQAQSELVRRRIANDIQQAADRYRALTQQAERVAEHEVGEHADLLEIATIAYDNGEMDLIELLDAAAAQQGAAMNAIRLRSDLWISYYDLERAAGGWDAAGSDEQRENGR
jgi:cobalt-zinc-cadmium efflux system outer membrane protein